MPKQYEAIRDNLKKRGYSSKKAKSIAAATWNKMHPDDTNPWVHEAKKMKAKHRARRMMME